MTTSPTDVESGITPLPSLGLIVRRVVLLGTPLALTGVIWFHPDRLLGGEPSVELWLRIHSLFMLLFGLLGVALYLLLADYQGRVATVGRIGVAIYAIYYVAMIAILGLATGVLIREAQALTAAQQEGVTVVVRELATASIVTTIANIAMLGYLIAVLAVVIVLRREGAPVIPLALLVGSLIGILNHVGLSGILGMGLFFIAVTWLEFGWTPPGKASTDQSSEQ